MPLMQVEGVVETVIVAKAGERFVVIRAATAGSMRSRPSNRRRPAMKASAPTSIYCHTAEPDPVWCAIGDTRKIAETYYKAAIEQSQCYAPLYRVVVCSSSPTDPSAFRSAFR